MLRVILFLCFIYNVNSMLAQCLYKPTQTQQQQLKIFQQNLNISLKKNTLLRFVPIQFHVLGTSAGLGYMPLQNVLVSLCEVNERFKSVGMYFYLADKIKYINDDELYQGKADAIWSKALTYKNENAINVFYHGLNSEGWCGVYFGGVDVVFVLNCCQTPGSTTLAHELGHLFSLPHTFSGWEGGNTPAAIEKLDGSNCRNAGDGFCDTKPDYVATRWGCPLPYTLTDPNGVKFKPDSSLYMNYALDNCHSRFSAEQVAAMQENLSSRFIAKPIFSDTFKLISPKLYLPKNNDTVADPGNISLAWQSINNAYAYHLQAARYGDWQYLNTDKLIYGDTSVTINLLAGWPYKWRVKPILKGNVCQDFSEPIGFYLANSVSVGKSVSENNVFMMYPNPAIANQSFNITVSVNAKVVIYSASGELIHNFYANKDELYDVKLPSGFYMVKLVQPNSTQIIIKKLMVLN